MPRKKLVVIGNGNSGKTSLLIVYTRDLFPEDYVPKTFDTEVAAIEVDDQVVSFIILNVWIYQNVP